MSYKIAVASSDEKAVNQHFGRSPQFLIFEVTGEGTWSFSELRENTPACGQGDHSDEGLQRTVDLLSDCRKVLVARIGLGAEQALQRKGITAFTVTDYIENAINRLIQHDCKCKRCGRS